MERLTVPDEKIEGGLRRVIIDAREVRKEAMTIYWTLKKYEDTGLTPPEIMELKERDTGYFAKTSIFDHESVVCKCGNDIEKDSGFKFCPYCGQRLRWEE